jgi:hypothetical protein
MGEMQKPTPDAGAATAGVSAVTSQPVMFNVHMAAELPTAPSGLGSWHYTPA